jgi:hypothetical protein
MSASSFRVKIPRVSPKASPNPLAAPSTVVASDASELPGTFITAMPAMA